MKQSIINLGLIILSLCFVGLVYGQSPENKVKDSFLKTIQEELKSLKAWSEEEKNNPQESVYHLQSNNSWHAFYTEYYEFEYDIKKTDSIVTPYIGIVTFKGREFTKIGTNKEECLNADWKMLRNATPTLNYAYQDGNWVIKRKPPFYRRHYPPQ